MKNLTVCAAVFGFLFSDVTDQMNRADKTPECCCDTEDRPEQASAVFRSGRRISQGYAIDRVVQVASGYQRDES